MEFSRQEYWSWLPFPSPGDVPDPGIKPGSSALQADSLLTELPGKPGPGSERGSEIAQQRPFLDKMEKSLHLLRNLLLCIHVCTEMFSMQAGVQENRTPEGSRLSVQGSCWEGLLFLQLLLHLVSAEVYVLLALAFLFLF